MRLSQVLIVATASFLLANEAIAVTMDSNQAKISTVAHGGPSQRLLRRNEKPIEDDSDDLDDLDSEERGRNSALQALATKWGYSIENIVSSAVKLSDKRYAKWQAALNKGIEANKKP